MAERILVLGGVRSGKSAVAERLVADAAEVVYIATGAAEDAEMAARIAAHRARRPEAWRTVETGDLVAAVRSAPAGASVLVDGLGIWLARRMGERGLWAGSEEVAPLLQEAVSALLAELEAFWAAAAAHPGPRVVLVADEAGLGGVPADPSARRWLDVAGEAAQRLSARADQVLLVVAGRVLPLPPSAAGLGGAEGEDLRAHGDRMLPPGTLDLAVNVHGGGPPPHVRTAIAAARDDLAAYPDPAAAQAAVAARHGRAPEDVVVTAGAAEALWLLPQALRPRQAAVVHPMFTEPEAALRALGVPLTRVLRRAEEDWALDPSAVPVDADFVVVGEPNNPTGTLDAPEVVAKLCRPGRITVVDEAFMDFVPDPGASLAGRGDLPGLVVVRSVTKLWGLAGLRAGYLLAAPQIAAACAGARQPWPVDTLALVALRACVGDEDWRRRTAEEVAAARADLVARLACLGGVRIWEGAANFVLMRVADGSSVHRRLLERGIAVRPSTFPGLDADHLRITVRGPAEHERLATALAEILREAR